MSFRRRIRPSRGGGYEVRLAAEERTLLTVLLLVGLLAVAYVYIWRKGALEWE